MTPGSGRPLGGGCGNPLQYSCLENHMERGVWWATAHRIEKKLDMTEATEHVCMHTPSTLLKFPTLAVPLPFHQMVLLCAFRRPWKPSGTFFLFTCFLRVSALLLLSWRKKCLSFLCLPRPQEVVLMPISSFKMMFYQVFCLSWVFENSIPLCGILPICL